MLNAIAVSVSTYWEYVYTYYKISKRIINFETKLFQKCAHNVPGQTLRKKTRILLMTKNRSRFPILSLKCWHSFDTNYCKVFCVLSFITSSFCPRNRWKSKNLFFQMSCGKNGTLHWKVQIGIMLFGVFVFFPSIIIYQVHCCFVSYLQNGVTSVDASKRQVSFQTGWGKYWLWK